jgi:signal transduction histidine kinase
MGRVTEEGRAAVGGLRTRQTAPLDLGQAFSEVRKEFEDQEEIAFHVTVEGTPRALHPIIADEIDSIGREALTNAFRHAKARSIEVELEYATRGLRVLIRDGGIGFDSEVLRFGREGHWGLSGMRERAKRIGARLRVLSRPAAGTEVEVTIPGGIAFIPAPPQGTAKWFRKFLRNWKHVIERSPSEYEQ